MSRTEYSVCLVVMSASATLSELTERLGLVAAYGSHSIGDPHPLKARGPRKKTVFQVCSSAGRDVATLEEHFESVAQQCSAAPLKNVGVLPADTEIYISVGVFSDAQIPTADLTKRCLAISESLGASVEVRLYMSDMGD
jgi:hypothetical protein